MADQYMSQIVDSTTNRDSVPNLDNYGIPSESTINGGHGLQEWLTHSSNDGFVMNPSSYYWSFVRDSSLSDHIVNGRTTLPIGSHDISFFPNNLVLKGIAVYDVCVRFRRELKLYAFDFEDFCTSTIQRAPSLLLTEIHMCFLNFILLGMEVCNMNFFTPAENDHSIICCRPPDHFTWGETLKLVLLSSSETAHLGEMIKKKQYPEDCTTADVIEILFSLVGLIHKMKILSVDNSIINQNREKLCGFCSKGTTLSDCLECPIVYHSQCIAGSNYRTIPSGNKCYVCYSEECSVAILYFGVSIDVSLSLIGQDSDGRMYWFAVRRLIVQDLNKEVYTYSSPSAVNSLLRSLLDDPENGKLVELIYSNNFLWRSVSGNVERVNKECNSGSLSVYVLDDPPNETNRITSGDDRGYIYYGYNRGDLRYNNHRRIPSPDVVTIGTYRFKTAKAYENKWPCDYVQIMKEFYDNNSQNVPPEDVLRRIMINFVNKALIGFEGVLPSAFLHPAWYHQLLSWAKAVKACITVRQFSAMLLYLSSMIKPYTFQSAWSCSAGHLVDCVLINREYEMMEEYSVNPERILVFPYQIVTKNSDCSDMKLTYDLHNTIDADSFSVKHYFDYSESRFHIDRMPVTVRLKPTVPHKMWLLEDESYRLRAGCGWFWQSRYPRRVIFQNCNSLDGILCDVIAKQITEVNSYSTLGLEFDIKTDPDLPPLAPLATHGPYEGSNQNSEPVVDVDPLLDIIPGENITNYFARKGSDLLRIIERTIKSSLPLETSPVEFLNSAVARIRSRFNLHSRNDSIANLFVLENYELRKIARQGGVKVVPGFLYNNDSKSNEPSNWPKCLPLPSISRVWELKLIEATQIGELLDAIKVLNNSLNMDLIKDHENVIENSENAHKISKYGKISNKDDDHIMIMTAFPSSADGLKYRYLIKTKIKTAQRNKFEHDLMYKFEDLSDDSAFIEQWVEEQELSISKVTNFWQAIDNERSLLQRKNIQAHKIWIKSRSLGPNPESKNVGPIQKPIKQEMRAREDTTLTPRFDSNRFPSVNSRRTPVCQGLVDSMLKEAEQSQYKEALKLYKMKSDAMNLGKQVTVLIRLRVESLLDLHADFLKHNLRRTKLLEKFESNTYSDGDEDYLRNYPPINFNEFVTKVRQIFCGNLFTFYVSDDVLLCKREPITSSARIKEIGSTIIDMKVKRSTRGTKKRVGDDDEFVGEPVISKQKTSSRIVCSCDIRDPGDKFFVSCKSCGDLIHGTCNGMKSNTPLSYQDFICLECQSGSNSWKSEEQVVVDNMLGCPCGEPVLRPSDGIICLNCSSIKHRKCMHVPDDFEETGLTFVCFFCQENLKTSVPINSRPLTSIGQEALKELTRFIRSQKIAEPFLKPVDGRAVPDYYTLINHPMDLLTLMRNVERGRYQTLRSYIRDMIKIFNNCRIYNSFDTFYVKFANYLQILFYNKIVELQKFIPNFDD